MIDLTPVYNQWQQWGSTFHAPNPIQFLSQNTVPMIFTLIIGSLVAACIAFISYDATNSISKTIASFLLILTAAITTTVLCLISTSTVSDAPRPNETVLEYVGKESGVKDLSCKYEKIAAGTRRTKSAEALALDTPSNKGYKFKKIPDGYYNCTVTITNTNTKDLNKGASVDTILNVRGDNATLTMTSNGEILKAGK